MKSPSMLERIDGELRRRGRMIRTLWNAANFLWLARALMAETHER